MGRMRRLGGITVLYALVAAVVVAAPATSEDPAPAPAPAAAPQAPASAPAPAAAAPAPPAEAPAAPAPAAPAAPAPAAQAPAAPAAAPAAPAAESQVLKDDAPAADDEDKPLAIAAASTGVTISDFKFAPGTVTVNVGDTVTWSNSGPTGHSATANDGSFDTGILQKGSSGSHTFSQAGTFSYICTPHPFMKGTVVVQAAASGDTGDTSGSGDTSSGTTPTDAQADSGPALPSTGMDVGGLALLGLMTLALGAYLRRRTAPQPVRPAGRIGW
jgi:LPXTG-motif cell wall-anchored protein